MTADELLDAVASAMCRDREEARVAVQIVVEECAKVADKRAEIVRNCPVPMLAVDPLWGVESTAKGLADAIRKLKP